MSLEIATIRHYLEETLGLTARFTPWELRARLPLYLRERFQFYATELLGQPCLLMIDQAEEVNAPAVIRKQMDQVRTKWEGELIYVRQQVASHHRKRLIEQRVPFLVPDNQMYLPMLGIDLREHFRRQRQTPLVFKPATQALVLHLLYRRDETLRTPVEFAERLKYTKMTMSRAFDELDAAQLCEIKREGRERQLTFNGRRKQLWEKSLPRLQSPTLRRHYLRSQPRSIGIPAGLTALAKYSMLAAPLQPTVAVSSKQWRELLKSTVVTTVPSDEQDAIEVEEWSYDPNLFATNGTVDRLSLYLSLKHDPDERVQLSLKEMLETVEWS